MTSTEITRNFCKADIFTFTAECSLKQRYLHLFAIAQGTSARFMQ